MAVIAEEAEPEEAEADGTLLAGTGRRATVVRPELRARGKDGPVGPDAMIQLRSLTEGVDRFLVLITHHDRHQLELAQHHLQKRQQKLLQYKELESSRAFSTHDLLRQRMISNAP